MRRGAAISAASLIFVQLVSIAQTLVLARILSPREVGIFYGGTVLTTLLVTLSEGGLRNALVQRHDDVEAAANTVFWASIAAGTLWSLLALAAAPVVAHIFHSPEAGMVAAVSAGSLLLYPLTYVPDSLLQRRFDFRQRILVRPSVSLTFAIGSVVLCSAGLGVWGLVAASYASLLVWICTSWSLARWRPRRGTASVAMWRDLARFGLPLVLGSLLDKAKETIDTIVVGSMFSATTVGQYRYGRRLGSLPGTVIIEVGSYVLFPAFARAADDIVRFRAAYLRTLRTLWFAAMPVAGMILAFGSAATVLLLGEPWRGAGVLFTTLAGAGPGVAMAAVGYESIKGYGRTSKLNVINATAFVVGVSLLLVLAPHGLAGVGLSLSATSLWSGTLSLFFASRLIGLKVQEHVEPMLPPLLAGSIAALIWGVLEHLVIQAGNEPALTALLLLTGEVLGLAVTYVLVLAVIAPKALSRLRKAVFPPTQT